MLLGLDAQKMHIARNAPIWTVIDRNPPLYECLTVDFL